MSDRLTTGWCWDSFMMLKHWPNYSSHTCRPQDVFSYWTNQTVQEGTKSNGYRGTGPGERVGSVNERSSHHRVVSGQVHDAQTSTPRPRTSVKMLRKSFFTPLTYSANRLPGSLFETFCARAPCISLLTHSPQVLYDHIVHMSHQGPSGTSTQHF